MVAVADGERVGFVSWETVVEPEVVFEGMEFVGHVDPVVGT